MDHIAHSIAIAELLAGPRERLLGLLNEKSLPFGIHVSGADVVVSNRVDIRDDDVGIEGRG